MANIKISELTSETELSENHIIITEQENATETKKSTLGLILNWIVGKLPIASNTVLGGIKVGSNLSIDSNGVLSATVTGTGSGMTDDEVDTVLTNVFGESYLPYVYEI